MLWQEKPKQEKFVVPDDVADLSFKIDCRNLPVDHAFGLSEAVRKVLPWMDDEPLAGIHSIYGAASSNGWVRPPDTPGNVIHLSKRSRLVLRLPKHRLVDAQKLCGKNFEINSHPIKIGPSTVKPLVPLTTIFSRSVCANEILDEEKFIQLFLSQLNELKIKPQKLLCGLAHTINCNGTPFPARSVLLADIELHESILLQQLGVGPGRKIGCGLFLPHKGITAVYSPED